MHTSPRFSADEMTLHVISSAEKQARLTVARALVTERVQWRRPLRDARPRIEHDGYVAISCKATYDVSLSKFREIFEVAGSSFTCHCSLLNNHPDEVDSKAAIASGLVNKATY